MPITHQWDNKEKTIIRADYVGEWTLEEYHAAHQVQLGEMLDSVNHKVDMIGVFTDAALPKDTLANFRVYADSPAFSHPNAGLIVNVVPSRFIATMVKIFGNVYKQFGKKIVIVASEEEAYQVIADHQRMRDVG